MSVVLPASPLSYEGQTALPYISKPFPPPASFMQAPVPCLWNDTAGKDAYVQTYPGEWVPIGGLPGQINTLTGNTGGPISPTADNINILGASGQIIVAGSGSTLTISLAGGGTAIDSFIPDAGTSPVVPTATGQVSMTGGNGIETTGGTNQLTFDMQSPFTGDFTFTDSVAGNTQLLTVSNTDNTAANDSSSALSISVAGNTQTGDPYALFSIGSSRSFCCGIDTSDSSTFKINTTAASSVTPSSGTNVLEIGTTGTVAVPAGDLVVARTEISGLVKCTLRNIDNTDADSSARYEVIAGNSGGTTGDAYILFSNLSVPFNYEVGQETTDNSFVIKYGSNSVTEQLSGTNAVILNSAGNIKFTQGQMWNVTTPGAYPYTVLVSDLVVPVDTSSARTINLPASPAGGEIHIIKDVTGSATANNITVQGNGHNIDGSSSSTISSNYDSRIYMYNSTSTTWMIL